MDQFIKEILEKTFLKDMEFYKIKVSSMMDNGKRVKNMVMEFILFRMVVDMKVSIMKIRNMEQEFTIQTKEKLFMGNGSREN